MQFYGRSLTFLIVSMALIQGVYGIQITASGGSNGESSSVSMNFDALKTAAVSSKMVISGADITPAVDIAGPMAEFEQTHAVTDASGKSASVNVKVVNAPNGLMYASSVLPNGGSVPAQTQVSAEQWLTVPKADSIKCTATSSYGILSANVDLEESKNAGWAGDYVTLKEYYGKALTTDTSVLATQTATSGAANSIKIYGTATDSSGTYSVDTPLKGISSRKATFQGLSETASAGSATQVEQEEHLHGSFTSKATYTPISGTPETNTRSSNYGTEYDLTMLAKKDASGPATWGTMSYYINPSRDLSAAATLDLNNAALVALRAVNSQYVYAESSGGEGVVANGDSIGPWETFDLINLGNNKYAFQAVNGQYVCAENGGGSVVVANRDAIGPWETFGLIDLGNGRYGLQAANGQYVCAEGGGGYGLVANRNAISAWETFNLVDQTETPVALRANNGQYVCAEDGGLNLDLYANRNAMGDLGKFQLIELGDNKVALKGVNGKYLCAENGGGGSIAPNRDWIGPWETFERTVDGSGGWAFRASNGQLLCAENGGGDKVLVNRNAIGPWETFSLEALGIQVAIDAAQPGDNINVAAGNYVENVNINKGLTLKGFGNPTAASFTLDAVLGTGSGGITAPVVNVNPVARIQDGVKFASSGGTVNAAAGTYRENVDIQKSLDIRGAGAGNTIVDGQQAGSVFTIGNQINSQVKVGLSDLTIQNGTGTSTIVLSEVPNFNPEMGGGVLNFADLTITSATISGNTAAAGGGVFNYRGIVNLEKSIITGNKAVARCRNRIVLRLCEYERWIHRP